MFHPSFWHLIILVLVVLLVVGPKRLPQLARSLGGALRDLRGSIAEDDAPTAGEKRDAALVEARQEPPAPPPEVAEAELAAEREAARPVA